MDKIKSILLAEDDNDDFDFFQKALSEIPVATELSRVKDGIELMKTLLLFNFTPDMIFLDINMPRKNGFQCLTEIRVNEKLKELPVIVFSTSSGNDIIRWMFNSAANCYIVKPNDYNSWKRVIEKAVNTDWRKRRPLTSLEGFLLQS